MSDRQDSSRELYAAMAKAFDELTYLRKTGEGAHAAVSHDAVKRSVRRAFQRAGLLLFPSEVERTVEPHVGKDGNRSGYLTSVVVDFQVVHVATGQSITMRASGQGYDTTDSGSTKAWSRAIKSWAIGTFLIESGFDAEMDDDDQSIDKDAIEKSFKRIKQEIYSVAPAREKADAKFAEIIGYYQTHSKRPVEDPREFQTRAHARQAFAALQQVVDIWSGQRFEGEAAKEAATPKTNGRNKREHLEITDDDLPPILRRELTDRELDAQLAKEEEAERRRLEESR